MRLCSACGNKVVGGYVLQGSLICCNCDVLVRTEMSRLREAGKPVSVSKIAQELLADRQPMSIADLLIRMSLLCKKWRKDEESQGLHDAADELFDLIVEAQRVRR